MSEVEPLLLDSRRHEREGPWADYYIDFDDDEAVATSPFRHSLEALKEFGFTHLEISHPIKDNISPETPLSEMSFEDDTRLWLVSAYKKVADSEAMIADNLGGKLTVCAEITPDGERSLEVAFGAGDYQTFNTWDLNETAWAYIEVIHKSLVGSWVGRRLPMISHQQEQ
jgi:hypothetical protein